MQLKPVGTWTGLACPDHGLPIGADVGNTTLQHLGQGEIADLIWEAPPEFTTEHGRLCHFAGMRWAPVLRNGATGELSWEGLGGLIVCNALDCHGRSSSGVDIQGATRNARDHGRNRHPGPECAPLPTRAAA